MSTAGGEGAARCRKALAPPGARLGALAVALIACPPPPASPHRPAGLEQSCHALRHCRHPSGALAALLDVQRRHGVGPGAPRARGRVASPPGTCRCAPAYASPYARRRLRPPIAQERRHLYKLWFRLTCLCRRRPITLWDLHSGIAAAYARHGFARQLTPAEWVQLALNAGYPPSAAALMPDIAAERAELGHGAPERTRCSGGAWQRRRPPLAAVPPVPAAHAGIPAWRYRYFMWWLHSQLDTLCLLRAEWEADRPHLICGFDCGRPTADAMLFRRAKVRAGWRASRVCLLLPGSVQPAAHAGAVALPAAQLAAARACGASAAPWCLRPPPPPRSHCGAAGHLPGTPGPGGWRRHRFAAARQGPAAR